MPIMDAVPLLDSATATILASVNKYTIQQHVKWLDNCIEMPNTYTVYNFQTARPRLETNVPRGPLRGRVGSRRGTTLGNPRFRARARTTPATRSLGFFDARRPASKSNRLFFSSC